jgi:NAD(P)H-hydrate epimerase
MIKVSAKKMQEIDSLAQLQYQIPSIVLMENAGLRASDIILKLLKRRKQKTVFIFCGPGNNGGDGFVVARHLINKHVKVRIFLLAESRRLKGDSLVNFRILKAMNAQVIEFSQIPYLKNAGKALKKAGLIVDALFGTGLNKDIQGVFAETINMINHSGVPVVSLDIPSGLCATTGKVFNVAVKANHTVTFAALKKGFFVRSGPKLTGRLEIADISIPKALLRR